MTEQRPIRVLCLDGGGVRGLSSLYIIKKLIEQVKEQEDPDHSKPEQLLRLCEYFDLICGTSTGGLIAIMLSRLGYVSGKVMTAIIRTALKLKYARMSKLRSENTRLLQRISSYRSRTAQEPHLATESWNTNSKVSFPMPLHSSQKGLELREPDLVALKHIICMTQRPRMTKLGAGHS